MTTSEALPASPVPDSHRLQLAAAGYLARFKGLSRTHAESDLRAYLSCCADRRLNPLTASRPHVKLYGRWMQEIRRLKPSTVSRRTSVVAGFYRTTVIDGLLEHSRAEHVRRPRVPAESPTLGLTHLQLEALPTAARHSSNQFDFALACLLGLLGLRIFEATGLNIGDLGEEHGHRVRRSSSPRQHVCRRGGHRCIELDGPFSSHSTAGGAQPGRTPELSHTELAVGSRKRASGRAPRPTLPGRSWHQ